MELERELAYKFHEGKAEGLAEGKTEKAIEAAVTIVKKYKASPEAAAADVGAPLEKVLEYLKNQK